MDLQNKIIGNIYTSQERDVIIIENLKREEHDKAEHITITHMLMRDLFFIERFRRDFHESVRLHSSEYFVFRVVNKELFHSSLKHINSEHIDLLGIVKEVCEYEKYNLLSKYAGEYFYLIATLYPTTEILLEKEENAS